MVRSFCDRSGVCIVLYCTFWQTNHWNTFTIDKCTFNKINFVLCEKINGIYVFLQYGHNENNAGHIYCMDRYQITFVITATMLR